VKLKFLARAKIKTGWQIRKEKHQSFTSALEGDWKTAYSVKK